MTDEGQSREQLTREAAALRQQVALLEQAQRQHQQTAAALERRIRTIDCLNDVGRRISENPSIAELLVWVADRIPSAMQYPDVCLAAVEFEGQIHGASETLSVPWQMVQGLRIPGDLVGRVYVSYLEQHDFADGESALLGDIARRLSLFVEQKRLEAALSAERNRLEAIVEHLPMGLIVTETLAGRPALVNDLAQQMLGPGIVDSVALRSGPDRNALFYQGTDRLYTADELPLTRGLLGETIRVDDVEVRRHDGSRALLEVFGAPVRDDSGRIVASLSTWQDVTQERQTEEELQRRASQMEMIADAASIVNGILDPHVLGQKAVDLIQDRFSLGYVGLFLVDEDGRLTGEEGRWAVLWAGTGEAGREQVVQGLKLKVDETSMIGWCIAHQEPQISEGSGSEPTRSADSQLADLRSELALPLVSRGQTIGALAMESARDRAFSQTDVSAFNVLTNLVANAVQNAQLFATTQESVERVQALYETGRALSLTLDEDEVMRIALRGIYRHAASKYAVAYVLDEETQVLECRGGIWEGEIDVYPDWVQSIGYPVQQPGVLTDVLSTAQTEIVAAWDSRFDRDVWSTYGHDRLLRAYLPIKAHEHILGVVEVGYDKRPKAHISTLDRQLLAAFVEQAAVALENALLFRRVQRTLDSADTLNTISAAASRSLQLDEVLREALSRLLAVGGYDAGLVSLVDSETGRLYVAVERDLPAVLLRKLQEDGLEGTLCEWVYRTGELLGLERLDQTSPVDSSGLVALGLRSYLGVPLQSGGQRLGTLCVFGREPARAGGVHQDLMKAVGQQVGAAVYNARLFEESQRALAEAEMLYKTNQRLALAGNVTAMVAAVAEGLSLTTVNQAILWMAEQGANNELESFVAAANWHSGEGTKPFPVGVRFGAEQFPALRFGRDAEMLVVEDLQEDGRFDAATRLVFAQANARASVLLPLQAAERPLGMLMLIGKERRRFSPRELRSCLSLAGQLAVAVDNQRLLEAARSRARREQLIREIADQMQQAVDLESLMRITADELSDAVGASRVYVRMDASLLESENALGETGGSSPRSSREQMHNEG